ncbi:MAG: dockerin type I domain-containing protein, partial [bacterium]|nr:dockerin type I domain-containing protein [bacterium]
MRFIISVFLLCMFLSPVSTSAQAVVSGAVTFSEDGVPAAGVRVTFFDLGDLHEVFSVITDSDGRFEMSPGAQDRPGLSSFRLMQNYPNPFNPSTVIPYELAKSASVRLEIFSVLGQRVRLLVDNVQPAGSYTENWDATDDQGQGVAAGVYLYALTVDGAMDTRRMVLLDGHKTSAGRGFPRSAEEGSSAVQQVGGTYGVTIYGPGTPISVHQPVVIGSGTGPLSFIVSRGGPQAVPKVQQQQANILGDVNNDGRVNISDALIVATYGLDSSISIPNGGDISLGDVNGDGRVNISDALIIATYGIDPSNASLPEGIGHAVAPGNQSPTLLNVALPGGATMDFVYIAPGTFTM